MEFPRIESPSYLRELPKTSQQEKAAQETPWIHDCLKSESKPNSPLIYSVSSTKIKRDESCFSKRTSITSIIIKTCDSIKYSFSDGLNKLPFHFNSLENQNKIISQRKNQTLIFNAISLHALKHHLDRYPHLKRTFADFNTLTELRKKLPLKETQKGIPLKKIGLLQFYKIINKKPHLLHGGQYPLIFSATHTLLNESSGLKDTNSYEIVIFSQNKVILRFPETPSTHLGKGLTLTCHAVYPLAVEAIPLAQTIISTFGTFCTEREENKKMLEAITNETILIQLQKTPHPHVPVLYSSSTHLETNIARTAKTILSTMELYPINLSDLSSISSLTDLQKLKCSIELISAVQNLHDKKILHRDIKPDNIFLTNDLSTILADFGFSSSFDFSDITLKNQAINNYKNPYGSRAYLAPEIFQCLTKQKESVLFLKNLNEEIYSKIDIWALLCTLWELWAEKENPYPWFNDLSRLMYGHGSILDFFSTISEFNKINHENPQLSPLFQLFLRHLQLDPANRPTAAALLIQFQEIQSNYQIRNSSYWLSEQFIQEVQVLNNQFDNRGCLYLEPRLVLK